MSNIEAELIAKISPSFENWYTILVIFPTATKLNIYKILLWKYRFKCQKMKEMSQTYLWIDISDTFLNPLCHFRYLYLAYYYQRIIIKDNRKASKLI